MNLQRERLFTARHVSKSYACFEVIWIQLKNVLPCLVPFFACGDEGLFELFLSFIHVDVALTLDTETDIRGLRWSVS